MFLIHRNKLLLPFTRNGSLDALINHRGYYESEKNQNAFIIEGMQRRHPQRTNSCIIDFESTLSRVSLAAEVGISWDFLFCVTPYERGSYTDYFSFYDMRNVLRRFLIISDSTTPFLLSYGNLYI